MSGTAVPRATGITAPKGNAAGTARRENALQGRRATGPKGHKGIVLQGRRATGPKGRKGIVRQGRSPGISLSVHRKNARQGRRMTEGTGTAIPKGNAEGAHRANVAEGIRGNARDARRATGITAPKGNAEGARRVTGITAPKGNAEGARRVTVAGGRRATGITVLTRMGVQARRTVLSRKSIK